MEAHDTQSDHTARMGETLQAASGDPIAFQIHLAACPRSTVHLFLDGSETPQLPPLASTIGNETLPFQWTSDGHAHWLRAEVRDSNGSLALLSNPIYIKPDPIR